MTSPPIVRIVTELHLDPGAAFGAFLQELAAALDARGLRFDAPGPGGRILAGDAEVGTVTAWEPGRRAVLAWRPAPWSPDVAGEVEIRSEAGDGGVARIVLEQHGWLGVLGEGEEPLGWLAQSVAAPLLAASSPAGLGDWITDRRARRPSGSDARATYRDPL